ncbi:hypothetical protein M3Y94_00803600 [Aphelenchoides besseyi]|nr:hypothetical protein M3Y94_00803600 [Aphelenchoides besseyi]KAI6232562.1 hypothetical protein M3Y95_00498800 [Aphelenchoides besseyi]
MTCHRYSRSKLALVVLTFGLANIVVAQRKPPVQAAENAGMAENMKKFQEIYGLATQLMNLGGSFLNNAQSPTSSSQVARDGGNGIFSEVRPHFKGINNFDAGPSYGGFDSLGGFGGLSNGGSEYGGGPLGSGSRSQPRSILDTLMGSFLGSSLSGPQSSSSGGVESIFKPTYDDYGSRQSKYGNSKGSNIDAIVDALSRSGAKRAVPEETGGLNAGSLLSQFFGGGR